MREITDLEREFQNEQKGEGSLSVYITGGDGPEYAGYDINPEDLEALYFEGIGVPRWETLQGQTVEEKTAEYWEKFNALMDRLPLISRMRDTDEPLEYSAAEVPQLAAECETVQASDMRVQRALKKITIAAARAAGGQGGLELRPSSIPDPFALF
jgi:hypothetical protein